jgi:ABC-type glycerol-3-phosphate transport system substrate-binding protein
MRLAGSGTRSRPRVTIAAFLAAVTLVGVACGGGTSTGSGGTGPTGAAACKDATLNMLMEDISETKYIQDLLPDFETKTGAKVKFELVAYSSMYEKLVPQLSGPEKSGTYDVVAVDYYWPGEFARSGWMLPLDDWIARDKVDYSGIFPASFAVNGTVDGKTYYVPYYTYPMGLVYRNDMGIEIPKTMEEYVALAKSLKKGDFAGAAMQGAPTDPIAMEWLNYLYANGGDLYDKDLKTPIINNEIGLKALNQYIDLIDNAGQTGAAGANLDDAMNQFAQGKAATMISYVIWAASNFQDPAISQVKDKWAVAPMPGTGIGNVGVWSFGVPKSSKNAECGWEFIKWVTSEDNARQRALKGSAPVYADFYKDPAILAVSPQLEPALKILETGKGLPMITKQQDLVATLGRELSEAASKRKTPQQALDAIAAKLKELAGG